MHVPPAAIRPRLEILAKAPVPTPHGTFDMAVFHWRASPSVDAHLSPDHVALVMGEIRGKRDVTVRVHSECMTSEVFGSLKCDCRDQLAAAQAEIGRRGTGMIIYLRQEGRGIGLPNKLRAYELQARGHDTVDANRMLGLPDDARDYGAAAAILAHFCVESVRLLTNNPLKIRALRRLGVTVDSRAPSVIAATRHSADYLETKRVRMGHEIPVDSLGALRAAGDAE